MIKKFNGKKPQIDTSAFVSKTANIIGDVEIGKNANIWPGAIIRGDFAKITIGENTSIEDNCVLHSATELTIGNNTIIGHGAVIHCRKIGNNVLIGNNATVLDEAEIGDFCIVAAGSVVAPKANFPLETLVVGVPAKAKGKLSKNQKEYITNGPAYNVKLAREYKKQGL